MFGLGDRRRAATLETDQLGDRLDAQHLGDRSQREADAERSPTADQRTDDGAGRAGDGSNEDEEAVPAHPQDS